MTIGVGEPSLKEHLKAKRNQYHCPQRQQGPSWGVGVLSWREWLVSGALPRGLLQLGPLGKCDPALEKMAECLRGRKGQASFMCYVVHSYNTRDLKQ